MKAMKSFRAMGAATIGAAILAVSLFAVTAAQAQAVYPYTLQQAQLAVGPSLGTGISNQTLVDASGGFDFGYPANTGGAISNGTGRVSGKATVTPLVGSSFQATITVGDTGPNSLQGEIDANGQFNGTWTNSFTIETDEAACTTDEKAQAVTGPINANNIASWTATSTWAFITNPITNCTGDVAKAAELAILLEAWAVAEDLVTLTLQFDATPPQAPTTSTPTTIAPWVPMEPGIPAAEATPAVPGFTG